LKNLLKFHFSKFTAALLSAAIFGLSSVTGYSITRNIAHYYTASVSAMGVSAENSAKKDAPTLIAGGYPFGIKLLMEGVMVTDTGKVDNISSPAEDAGIKKGDVITSANGTPLTSNNGLSRIIAESRGKSVTLELLREGNPLTVELSPVFSEKDKIWRSGMWVRDSIAGIGTMTFAVKDTGEFSGLGHPVCDCDTGELIPLHSGEAVPVKITNITKGMSGSPGALHGKFTGLPSYGTLSDNNNCGIFGDFGETALYRLEQPREYKLGYPDEVTEGEAFILSTISGTSPQMYSVCIEEKNCRGNEPSKNMIIRITDERLIAETGGIVQGMSGSPIIQNDRIIGAVTHVFVADPTRGYGIFAENMYNEIHP
jgi:stage IV sporulation protein B